MSNLTDFTSELLSTPYPTADPYGSLLMPVYNTAAFEFESAERMALAFTGRNSDHAYSRITNPTVANFEQRIRRATGALSVTALNSGMAAISNTFMSLARAGSNIVTSPHLFGNTYSLLAATLSDFGVDIRFCDMTDTAAVAALVDGNTAALFVEVLTNPQLEVADLRALSAVAHSAGVPLVADTTVIPFCCFKAADFGVDIEIVSTTKYISGGATSIGGVIIDHGRFDFSGSPKFKALLSVGVPPCELFTAKLRREVHRNLGAYMNPQVAYMQNLGLETLEVRFRQAASTTMALARGLESLPAIRSVNYTGLESSPFYALSLEQFGPLPGAMLTFDLESEAACFAMLNRLKVIRRATNLFDNRSLAIHPWSTIFGNFSESVRRSMDISECTIRISVGLEAADVLLEDIRQAL